MRNLTPIELHNVSCLNENGIPFVLVKLTPNILHHSIFDATLELRRVLKNSNVHNYDEQMYGEEHKCFIETHILTFKRELMTNSSLYKSRKRGDCRMWLGSSIKQVVEENDVVVIMPLNKELFVINVSHIEIENCLISPIDNPVKRFIQSLKKE